jgi:hypothetical protein
MSETTPEPPGDKPAPLAIDQFRAIAGAASSAKEFVIRGSNGEIDISYNGFLAHSITLRAPFPTSRGKASGAYRGNSAAVVRAGRPLRLQLSKEGESERRSKAKGVNREAQTGDPAFDGEVYIDDNGAPQEHVRAVFAHEEARAATLALLRENTTFMILDDIEGDIAVCYTIAHGEEKDPQRAARIVDAFDKLLGSVPQLEEKAPEARWLPWWAVLGLLVGPPIAGAVALVVTTPSRCRAGAHDLLLKCSAGPECCQPVAAGTAGGLAVAALIAFFLLRRFRGKSDSSMMRKFWITLATILSVEAAVLLARLLW